MAALPPVFVEFIGAAGSFMATSREVKGEIRSVSAEGGTTFDKFGAAGRVAMLAVGAAAAYATVKAVGMATTFQSQMELLVTAAGEAQSNLKSLESGALSISRSTGVGSSQIAAGLYIVEKAGYRANDALKITKAAAQGAVAEGVDMSTMAQALTSVMFSYHEKSSQAVSTTNQMVVAAGQAKTTMAEFAASLATVIPLAANAHINFAQVAGAIDTLTQHGTSAQEATQMLANSIRNLQAPSQVAQSMMQQMGLGVVDLETNLGKRGLTGTLQIITQAIAEHTKGGLVYIGVQKQMASASQDLQTMLSHMPPALADVSRSFLAGQTSFSDYRKAFRGMGAEGVAEGSQFSALAQKVKGFSDQLKTGQPIQQTMAAVLKNIMGGAMGLNTALQLTGGNMPSFINYVNKVSEASKGAGKNIETWAKTSATLKVQINQAKQAIETGLITVGLKLIDLFEKYLVPVIRTVIGWFQKHKQVTKELGAALLGILAVGLAAAGAALVSMLADVLVAVAPFLLLGAAIGLLGKYLIGLYKHNAKFREFVQRIVTDVRNAFTTIVSWLQSNGPRIWHEIQSIFEKAWHYVEPVLIQLWRLVSKVFGTIVTEIRTHGAAIRSIMHQLGEIFKVVGGIIAVSFVISMKIIKFALDVITNLWDRFGKHLVDHIITALHAVIQIIQGVFEIIHGVFDFFSGLFTGKWSKMWKGVKEIFGGIWNAISGIFKSIINIISTALGAVVALLSEIFGKLFDMIGGAMETAFSAVGGFLERLPGMILRAVGGAIQWLLKVGENVIKGLFNGIVRYAPKVLGWFIDFPFKLIGFFAGASLWLLKAGLDLLVGLFKGIGSGGPSIWNWFKQLPGTILGLVASAGTWLLRTGMSIIKGAWNGIVAAAKDVWNWFTSLPGAILHLLTTAGKWLYQTGISIIKGAWNGIVDGAKDMWNWLLDLPKRIMSFFAGAGDWLLQIGRDIINGLIHGIEDAAKGIGHAVSRVAGDIGSGFSKALHILSPSRVMAEKVGKPIVAGIAMGMLDNTQHIKAAITQISNELISTRVDFPHVGVGGVHGVGAGGHGGGNVNIYVTVMGSVQTEKDLAMAIQTQFLRVGMRRGLTYQAFKRQ